MTNDTLNQLLNRRSIREFTTEPLAAADRQTLIDAARHTASSKYLQSFSLLSVTDPAKRQAIAKISQQDYVAGPGELFIFLVDQYRASRIAALHTDQPTTLGGMDKFLQGAADATLAAQTFATAAESLGLGTVFLGSIQNDVAQLYDLLDLPDLTFPLLGVLVGHPGQPGQQKPRLPEALMHFENAYALPADLAEQMQTYDPAVHSYYAGRNFNRREETFSAMLTQAAIAQPPARRGELLALMRQHGWFPEA